MAFDQLCFCPFLYLPAFFVMREFALNTGQLPAPTIVVRNGLHAWSAMQPLSATHSCLMVTV